MLEEVRITALGVIDDAVLELSRVTVVTGDRSRQDHGGDRAGPDVRHADPDRSARIPDPGHGQGHLRVNPAGRVAQQVTEAGGELDNDGTLIVSRSVSAKGHYHAFAGGRCVPVSLLTYLADDLVAVHGQADQQQLLRQGRRRHAGPVRQPGAGPGGGRLPPRLPAAPGDPRGAG